MFVRSRSWVCACVAETRCSRFPRVCVFAPAPLLTVTIEQTPDATRHDEIHLHAGGQGFWIARLLEELGVEAVLCSSFGGETGRVLRTLVSSEGIDVRGVDVRGNNGAYVHDRRSGERVETANMPGDTLTRHELDELYGKVLLEGMEAGVTVLGGPASRSTLPASTYRRLASDLRSNGATVVADLSGDPQRAALEGGVDVIKVSHDELCADGRITDQEPGAVVDAMRTLAGDGAEQVVVTRAAEPALALVDGALYTITPPRLSTEDHRGAGDSLTAGIAATLAQGGDLLEGLRFGSAAGALNVTRRGLATARREEIERLACYVDIRPVDSPDANASTAATSRVSAG